MFQNIGSGELLVIGIVALLLFGTKKLNEVARGLGESSKEFKKVTKEYQKALKQDFSDMKDKEEKEEVKKD